jgi:hypothetical protein
MKLSELIASAQQALAEHGDLLVAGEDTEYDCAIPAVAAAACHQWQPEMLGGRDDERLGDKFFVVVTGRLPADEIPDERFPMRRLGMSQILHKDS